MERDPLKQNLYFFHFGPIIMKLNEHLREEVRGENFLVIAPFLLAPCGLRARAQGLCNHENQVKLFTGNDYRSLT